MTINREIGSPLIGPKTQKAENNSIDYAKSERILFKDMDGDVDIEDSICGYKLYFNFLGTCPNSYQNGREKLSVACSGPNKNKKI